MLVVSEVLFEQQEPFVSVPAGVSVPGVVGVVDGCDDVDLVAPPPQQLPMGAPEPVPLAIGACLFRSPLACCDRTGEANG